MNADWLVYVSAQNDHFVPPSGTEPNDVDKHRHTALEKTVSEMLAAMTLNVGAAGGAR